RKGRQPLERAPAPLPELKREQQELQQRLQELEQIRPQGRESAPLVDELRGLAADEGLARVSIEEVAAGAESDTLPIRLRAEGSQPELVALLDRLRRTTRLLRLPRGGPAPPGTRGVAPR